jgi:uncharacterized Zn-finger protein
MKEMTPVQNRACSQEEYTVTQQDLPLSCPMPKYRLWDAHPRVYLPIEITGREVCPYCGAIYILNAPTKDRE